MCAQQCLPTSHTYNIMSHDVIFTPQAESFFVMSTARPSTPAAIVYNMLTSFQPHISCVCAAGGIIFRNEHGKAKDVPQVLTLATSQVLLLDYPRKNVSDATLNYLTR